MRTRRDSAAERRRNRLFPLLALLVALVMLVAGVDWLWGKVSGRAPVVMPPAEQCLVQVGGVGHSLTLEQSSNAAIIVAEALRRGLPARASSIALATAFQESDLRNIDYGDRDSVGLFQQRPSQGWGTVEQIMDPWYSAGKFYEHLVEVPGWQSGDINDVAQKVQRSGVPDGYRKHVEVSKAWASAMTGHSPAAITCIDRGDGAPDTKLARTIAQKLGVKATAGQAQLTLSASDPTKLWAATHLVMMTTETAGFSAVDVQGRTLQLDTRELPSWRGASASPKPTETTLTLRA